MSIPQPLLRYAIAATLCRPRAPLRVVVIATERPAAEYLALHRELGAGSLVVLDCHSDPHGWASTSAPNEESAPAGAGGATHNKGEDGGRVVRCRLDPGGGFRGVVAGAKTLAGGEKALIVLDSVYPLVSAGGISATSQALRALSSMAPVMCVVHMDLLAAAGGHAAQDLAHQADAIVTVLQSARGAGGEAPGGVCEVCQTKVVRRRDVGTVSIREGVLEWSADAPRDKALPAGGYRFRETEPRDAQMAPPDPDDEEHGVSFNLQLSESERKQRAAVSLPFQRHLAPRQDRGTTSGDLEDAIQIHEDDDDEEEEEDDEEEDDADADLDI
ncbi:hypothetical protein T484DRAFT_1945406 [Baffinella frigidus]|nr:hypothetical protein T484DRAFT_1945406 [Cryptophyta sp. CCMP2293]